MKFRFDDRTRALLHGVWMHGTISAAAVRVGMDPANASRHVRAAERRNGIRLVDRRPGGRGGGNAALTPAGRRFLRLSPLAGLAGDFDPVEGITAVRVGDRTLFVAGRIRPGPVEIEIRPESVALERAAGRPRATSVRNRLPARVERIEARPDGVFLVRLSAGSLALSSLVVRGALRDLRLRVGSRVHATIKAVSIRSAVVTD